MSAAQRLDVSDEVVEKDSNGRLLRYFDLRAIAEIDELLAQRVVPGQIDENTFNAVRAAMATTSSNAMNNVANAVFSHLESGGGIQADELVFMLKILRFSRSAGLIEGDQYAEFATSGHYLHHLYQAASESHPEAVGECVFGYLEAVPDASLPSQVGNSNAGHEKLTEILQNPDTVPGAVEHFTVLAKEAQQLPVVFEMATEERTGPPFLRRVLKTLLMSEDVSKPIELVRTNWSLIQDVLEKEKEGPQSPETFLKGLPGLDRLVVGVIGSTFDVHESSLYVALLKSSADTNLVTWCSSGLSAVNRDAWTKEIKPQGDLVELVIELKKRGARIALDFAYLDALTEYARSVAGGLTRIHRRTALGTALEEASGCSSESGIMVLEQKPARKQGAPNRCCHRTNPTVSASSLTTIAWWPMLACSCRPP